MKSKLDETLCVVAEDILESLAFVLLAPEDDAPPAADNAPDVVASITFAGPFDGTLFLRVSGDMLPTIAGNMLGLNFGETSSQIQQEDAFKELLNVICGNLLPKFAGSQAVFNIYPPKILPDERIPATFQGRPAATALLELEEGTAELAFFTDTTHPKWASTQSQGKLAGEVR